MTDRRTLTHRHGSLFDETNIALWLAAMDARAAASRPVVRRLSISELPASPSGRDPRPGEDRARTEASADVGPSGAPDASTTNPRLIRDRKGTESAGALQPPSQRMRSQPGLPPHSGTPSSAAMGARAQAARGG